MEYTRWADMPHKAAPERREEIKREAIEELHRMGYAELRKARELTQVEIATTLGVSQARVAGIERHADLQISTLSKYIRALGGRLEMQAIFPEATINIEPLPPIDKPKTPAKRKPATFTKAKPAIAPKRRAAVAS